MSLVRLRAQPVRRIVGARSLGVVLAVCVLGAWTPALSADEVMDSEAPPVIYKWVDENGIAHYTTDLERIPRSLRGGLRLLGPEASVATTTQSPSDPDWWALRDAPSTTSGAWEGSDPVLDPYVSGSAPDVAGTEQREGLDQQIAAIEAEIVQDEESLKDMISDPERANDPLALGDEPEFREIARRLPKLQADLAALLEERDGLEGL